MSDQISELKVMKSNAGYYLGHSYHDEEIGYDLPYSRETDYMSKEQAINYLASLEAQA